MPTIELSQAEIADVRRAIENAQNELCYDLEGGRYPEGTAQYKRWEDLLVKLATLNC